MTNFILPDFFSSKILLKSSIRNVALVQEIMMGPSIWRRDLNSIGSKEKLEHKWRLKQSKTSVDSTSNRGDDDDALSDKYSSLLSIHLENQAWDESLGSACTSEDERLFILDNFDFPNTDMDLYYEAVLVAIIINSFRLRILLTTKNYLESLISLKTDEFEKEIIKRGMSAKKVAELRSINRHWAVYYYTLNYHFFNMYSPTAHLIYIASINLKIVELLEELELIEFRDPERTKYKISRISIIIDIRSKRKELSNEKNLYEAIRIELPQLPLSQKFRKKDLDNFYKHFMILHMNPLHKIETTVKNEANKRKKKGGDKDDGGKGGASDPQPDHPDYPDYSDYYDDFSDFSYDSETEDDLPDKEESFIQDQNEYFETTKYFQNQESKKPKIIKSIEETQNYSHLWVQCENCYGLNYKKFFFSTKLNICESCGFNLKMSSSERLELPVDQGTWNPMDEDMISTDPIKFDEDLDTWEDEALDIREFEEDINCFDPLEDPFHSSFIEKAYALIDYYEAFNPIEVDEATDPTEKTTWPQYGYSDPIKLYDGPNEYESNLIALNLTKEEGVSEDCIDFELESEEEEEEEDYIDRLDRNQEETGLTEAVQTGTGQLNGIPLAIGVMDFEFIGGSMGSVVGEKITRLIEYASKKGLPLILVCASGGARMQEGSLSLMQMAKISAALHKYQTNKKSFYISMLTSPTTGGVTASFGMLGDIIITEPDADIAFTGKRVIEQTLNLTVPEDLQTAEYLFEKGLFDLIIPRNLLKNVLSELLQLHGFV